MIAPESKPGLLKGLLILHKAMLAGQVLFAAIAFYLVYSVSFHKGLNYPDKILQVCAIVFSAVGFYAGSIFFKRKYMEAREMQTIVKEKFAVYQYACIIQWALIEGPCLFVITCFLLTGNYAFLALAAVLLLLFAMMAPSRLKIIYHLQLNEKEAMEL